MGVVSCRLPGVHVRFQKSMRIRIARSTSPRGGPRDVSTAQVLYAKTPRRVTSPHGVPVTPQPHEPHCVSRVSVAPVCAWVRLWRS